MKERKLCKIDHRHRLIFNIAIIIFHWNSLPLLSWETGGFFPIMPIPCIFTTAWRSDCLLYTSDAADEL